MEKKICIKNSCGKIYTPENDEEYEARTCCGICGAPVEVDLGDYPYEIVEEERIVKKIEPLPGQGPRVIIYKGREKDSIEKIISILLEKGTFSKEKFIEKTATTLACRLSIKANDYISLEEADYLLETIRTCENPFTCPHGRPTIITYSNYELEKMFKRVMN